jgi:catechol 2,3-dioxygenase
MTRNGGGTLPATTKLGPAHLTVTSLDRSLPLYRDVLGLALHRRDDGEAVLGDGATDVLVLREEPLARPAGRHAGLYHVALLYPTRAELARAAVRLAATRTRISGASDHGTHEAIYLDDPDGNGVELAADRPREVWPTVEQLQAHPRPDPLDVDGLFGEVAGEEPRPRAAEGVRVGHVHLHVSEIEPTIRFYRDGLGFDISFEVPSVAFFSAGGYHHHVGTNTWRGVHVPPAPVDAVGLRHFTVQVPAAADVEAAAARLRSIGVAVEEDGPAVAAVDPSGNRVVVELP